MPTPLRTAVLDALEQRRLLSASYSVESHVFGEAGVRDDADAVTVDAAGRTVVAGAARYDDADGYFYASALRLTRLGPDGAPDPTFGVGGTVEFEAQAYPRADFEAFYSVGAVEVGPDGGIYVAGSYNARGRSFGQQGGGDGLFVQRFEADGTPDPEFAFLPGDGVMLFGDWLGGGVNGLAVLPDGSALIYGSIYDYAEDDDLDTDDNAFVAKLTPTGAFDAGFGNATLNGTPVSYYPLDFDLSPVDPSTGLPDSETEDEVVGLDVLPDGRLAAFVSVGSEVPSDGWTDRAGVLVLNPDGTRDASFGDDGLLVFDVGLTSTADYYGVAEIDGFVGVVAGDGGYYLGLEVDLRADGGGSGNDTYAALKLDAATLEIDGSFGTNGVAARDFGDDLYTLYDLAADPLGGVVLVGEGEFDDGQGGTRYSSAALRFDADGHFDPDLGAGGLLEVGSRYATIAPAGDDRFSVVSAERAVVGTYTDSWGDTYDLYEYDTRLTFLTRERAADVTVTAEYDPATGALAITGSDGDDEVALRAVAGAGDSVRVEQGGVGVGTFAGVSRVVVDLLAGDDDLMADADLAVPVRVDGGAGNDSIVGGAGDDTLSGGAGVDVLDSAGGFYDELRGGQDNDLLRDSDGVRLAEGGDGDDAIDLVFAADWVKHPALPIRLVPGSVQGNLGDDTIRVHAAEGGSRPLTVVMLGDNVVRSGPDGSDNLILTGDYGWGSVMLPDSFVGCGDADYAPGQDSLYAQRGGVFVIFDCTFDIIGSLDDANALAAAAVDDLLDQHGA